MIHESVQSPQYPQTEWGDRGAVLLRPPLAVTGTTNITGTADATGIAGTSDAQEVWQRGLAEAQWDTMRPESGPHESGPKKELSPLFFCAEHGRRALYIER